MEKLNELKVKFDRLKTILIASSIIDLVAAIFLIVSSVSSTTDKMTLNEILYIVVIVLSSIIVVIDIVSLLKLNGDIKQLEKEIKESENKIEE